MRPQYALLLPLLIATPAAAQTAADSSAIRATALDYVEGWYTGDAERMTRAVHPELVKRIVVTDTVTGKSVLQNMGGIRSRSTVPAMATERARRRSGSAKSDHPGHLR